MTRDQKHILARTGIVAAFAAALLLPINHVVNGNGSAKIVDPFNAQLNAQLVANATEACRD